MRVEITIDEPTPQPCAGDVTAEASRAWSLAESQAYCRRLARSHYENFVVASWFLPKRLRQHFYNVYAFCRLADDAADESESNAAALARLNMVGLQLEDCYQGQRRQPVFVALGDTIDEFGIPIDPLSDLLVAFRQDQIRNAYSNAEELIEYCRYSANPVGRLVLYLDRSQRPETVALSDSICTGLQLANFWQDVARDWEQGRRYLPNATLNQFESAGLAFDRRQANSAFRRALAHEVDRAERYLTAGLPLVDLVSPDLRIDMWMFVAGGRAVLRKIRELDYDVWARRPTISRGEQLALLARGWWRNRRGRLAQVDP